MALKTSLISHWKLGEASGTRADSHGTNDLTDNNTVGSATGKLGNAADFEADNDEYLDRTDNSDLSTGDFDFTLALWINAESFPSNPGIICKENPADTSKREYRLDYLSAGPYLRWVIFDSTGASADVLNASTFGALSTGTWYFVVVDHDAASNLISIQINNGTKQTMFTTLVPSDTTAPFMIGRYGGALTYWDGLVDSVSFWKRLLTDDERTELYNSGNGLDYDDWDTSSSVSITRLASYGISRPYSITGAKSPASSSVLLPFMMAYHG